MSKLELEDEVRVPITPRGREVQHVVNVASAVQPVFSIGDAECVPSNDPLTYPYDIQGVLDTLANNGREGMRPGPFRQVEVLVADSGLVGADGRKGSIFGLGVLVASSEAGEGLRPVNTGVGGNSNYHHGTQVASLVLGGPIFARLNAIEGQNRIQLNAVRLYTLVKRPKEDGTEEVFVGLPSGELDKVLRDPGRADIINLSLKTEDEPYELKRHLDAKEHLFVVAAGNGDGSLDTDADKKVFPAQWGGLECAPSGGQIG